MTASDHGPARWTGGKRSVQANTKAGQSADTESPAPEPVPAPETGTEIVLDEPAQALTRPIDVDATDAARTLAAERGVQLTAIKGTGKDGRITAQDVEDAATGD